MNKVRCPGRSCSSCRDTPLGINKPEPAWFGNSYRVCDGTRGRNSTGEVTFVPDDRNCKRPPTEAPLYVGARNSPWNQPTVSIDFIGSASAATIWWTRSQAGHSNVRMSKPDGPGVIRASIVIVWHLGQGGRRMIMMHALGTGGSATLSQSPGSCREGTVMEPICSAGSIRDGQYRSRFKIISG